MNPIDSIKTSISGLGSREREELFLWMRARHPPDEYVAETAAAYAIDPLGPSSVEEFMAAEELASVKQEYVAGRIFAMTGASRAHNLIAGSVYSSLRGQIRGGPCRVFMSDFKVALQVGQADILYYPDVVMSCQRSDNERLYLRSPSLVVEVLSSSTARIDQCEKFWNYRQISSLEEYCLIHQDRYEVAVFDRRESWRPRAYRLSSDAVIFRSASACVAMADIYADVEL